MAPRRARSSQRYLAPVRDVGADVLALGCTHYAFLRGLIEQEARRRASTVIEPSEAVARQVRARAATRAACCNPRTAGGGVRVPYERRRRARSPQRARRLREAGVADAGASADVGEPSDRSARWTFATKLEARLGAERQPALHRARPRPGADGDRRRRRVQHRHHRSDQRPRLRLQAERRLLRGAGPGARLRRAAQDARRHPAARHHAGRRQARRRRRTPPRAYAQAIFDDLGFDACTVNPYLGCDSIEPWIERPDKAAIILCRTSNPGAPDLQDLPVQTEGGTRPLYEVVAERAKAWDRHGNVGLVVGATYPGRDAAPARALPGHAVPGAGHRRAGRASLGEAVRAGLDARGAGLLDQRLARRHVRIEGRRLRAGRARAKRCACATRSTANARPRSRPRRLTDGRDHRLPHGGRRAAAQAAPVRRLRVARSCGSAPTSASRCTTCKHRVLLDRRTLEKRLKAFVSRGPEPDPEQVRIALERD